jgi:hypothetical protein
MRSKYRPYSFLVIICLVLASPLRAQDNPLEDADLKDLLKQAQKMQKQAAEIQKQNPSVNTKKKLAEMEAQTKEGSATGSGGKTREGKVACGAEETTRCAWPRRVPRLDSCHSGV